MPHDLLISPERRAALNAMYDELYPRELPADADYAHRVNLTDDDRFFLSLDVCYTTIDDKPATVTDSHDQYQHHGEYVYLAEHVPLRDLILMYYADCIENADDDAHAADLVRRRDADLARLCP